jgi:fatty acid elongase 2/fatty acid elongase 3
MSNFQVSVDRPFGVYLYDYFATAYELVAGKSPDEFAFVQGKTPLSTLPEGK